MAPTSVGPSASGEFVDVVREDLDKKPQRGANPFGASLLLNDSAAVGRPLFAPPFFSFSSFALLRFSAMGILFHVSREMLSGLLGGRPALDCPALGFSLSTRMFRPLGACSKVGYPESAGILIFEKSSLCSNSRASSTVGGDGDSITTNRQWNFGNSLGCPERALRLGTPSLLKS